MPAKPQVALIILDGWGIAPDNEGNAVTRAHTPFIDSLFAANPHGQLLCYGEAVGLPEGQMGNSEVGHLNLGSGRVVYQEITLINKSIKDGSIKQNPVLNKVMDAVKDKGSTLHFMGLVSDGGVHSLQEHLYALIDSAVGRGVDKIAIHAFLDGRDTPPDSGADYLQQLQDVLARYRHAFIASVSGRYYAMDRDKRWDRVAKAYEAIVRGQGNRAADPVQAVRDSYKREVFDEFVEPTVICRNNEPLAAMQDGDGVIFFNFRGDRARELTWALTQQNFTGFDVSDRPRLAGYVCLTDYDEAMHLPVAFPPQDLHNTLAETLSKAGLTQLHMAETEKYAHVTFFFNGGREEPFPGEDRLLIPSPKDVATYDQKPAMSALEVTEEALKRVNEQKYDFLLMNYANCDMVGHTGVFAAAKEAVEVLDKCLQKLFPVILRQGGSILLTADHGNAEQMIDFEHGGPYTAHTTSNPVPLLYITQPPAKVRLDSGALCDVAPTCLKLLGLPQPAEMTGKNLIEP